MNGRKGKVGDRDARQQGLNLRGIDMARFASRGVGRTAGDAQPQGSSCVVAAGQRDR